MKTQKSFFEQSGGSYMQAGDVLLSDLSIGDAEVVSIGKYGRMHKRYLIEERPCQYTRPLVTCELFRHLAETDTDCAVGG